MQTIAINFSSCTLYHRLHRFLRARNYKQQTWPNAIKSCTCQLPIANVKCVQNTHIFNGFVAPNWCSHRRELPPHTKQPQSRETNAKWDSKIFQIKALIFVHIVINEFWVCCGAGFRARIREPFCVYTRLLTKLEYWSNTIEQFLRTEKARIRPEQ